MQRETSSRAEPVEPPPIDPRDHAVYSHQWGERSCYLLLYQGWYYTWITDPSVNGRPEVGRVPSEQVGRLLVDEWQARNVLRTGWGEAIEHIFLTDPGLDEQICYHATVVDVEGSGLWLAGQGALVAGETGYVVGQFTELGFALTALADQAEAAADQAGRDRTLTQPDVLAGVLRSRAAKTRADVARARLGDALRARWGQDGGQAELDQGLSPALHAAGLNPETFRQVLAGREFTWPTGPVVRPPGSRRADTPVTVLAEYTVEGQQFTLECYRDSAGANCVAIVHDGHPAVVKDVSVDERNLVSQGSMLTSTRGGLGAIYGRAHDSVTALYSVSTDGQRTDWPIYDDPRSGERYFAVVANPETLADIVAEAPAASTSLKGFFGMWFNPPDHRRSP